ncbi:MAG TPA: SET domain-containing protein, partial [Candidatus Paceibacterota bacterium]
MKFLPKQQNQTYFTFLLKPSSIVNAGVGCFANKRIPAGTQINTGGAEDFRRLQQEEIPDEYLKFCVLLSNGKYLSPHNFLKMGVFWYINHAKEPNLCFENSRLSSLRDIDTGEEL